MSVRQNFDNTHAAVVITFYDSEIVELFNVIFESNDLLLIAFSSFNSDSLNVVFLFAIVSFLIHWLNLYVQMSNFHVNVFRYDFY